MVDALVPLVQLVGAEGLVDGVGRAVAVPLFGRGGVPGGLGGRDGLPHPHVRTVPKRLDGVTEAGVVGEELSEAVTRLLVVSAAAAVAVGTHADLW